MWRIFVSLPFVSKAICKKLLSMNWQKVYQIKYISVPSARLPSFTFILRARRILPLTKFLPKGLLPASKPTVLPFYDPSKSSVTWPGHYLTEKDPSKSCATWTLSHGKRSMFDFKSIFFRRVR